MEDMFLRVCVALVSLLSLKDHSVIEELDNIMSVQEPEYLLLKEGAKLEQEVHPVAMEPPQVSQSHHRLTKGEDEESDVQQILPNGKVEKPHEHQMPPREGQDILLHNALTEDNQDELQTDKTAGKVSQQDTNVDRTDMLLNEKLPPEETQSEIIHAIQNEAKQTLPKGEKFVSQGDEASVHKKEDPHPVDDQEALVTHASHLNEVESTDKQESSEESKKIPPEEHKSFFQQIVARFIPRWSQDAQEEHVSPDNGSLQGSKKLQIQSMQKQKQMTQTEERTSKFNQEVSLTSEEIPHAGQKPFSPSQVQTKASQREHSGSENIYTWFLWKVLSLISVIRLLRKFIGKNSKTSGRAISIMEGKKLSATTNISAKISLLDHNILSCFYDQCVCIPPSTCEQVCDFVEGFVDELLEAARNTSSKGNDLQIGEFVGIGSFYECWATGKVVVCDLYVPVTAPRSYSFEIELEIPRCGRIKLVKAENTSNGCPCSKGVMDDEDMLCLLHPHNETSSINTDAIGGPLCQENTPYLAKTQVIRWFRKTLSKAWVENSHKYEFELVFRHQAAPGALKVRLRSGQVIIFNITPVVRIKDSDMYLVSYLASDQITFSETQWLISLASYENALLQYFNKSHPTDSCHIQCLQILSFLHKQQIRLSGKCGLTSYHLKIALQHLLLATKPEEWKNDQLSGRLNDILMFLEEKLKACKFHHSLVGNPSVPSSIRLPKDVHSAKPTNIFLPLVSNREMYLKTVQHLQELVKNTPLLIHEYVSTKCSDL